MIFILNLTQLSQPSYCQTSLSYVEPLDSCCGARCAFTMAHLCLELPLAM